MDPLNAPARLDEGSDASCDEASTPIAHVAENGTQPLYSVYGTSSIFVRVDDVRDDDIVEESKNEDRDKHEEEPQQHAVMIVPVANMVGQSTGGCLPALATIGFFTLLVTSLCLLTVLSNMPDTASNHTPFFE